MQTWSITRSHLVTWKTYDFWEDAIMGMRWDCTVTIPWAMAHTWEGMTKPPPSRLIPKSLSRQEPKGSDLTPQGDRGNNFQDGDNPYHPYDPSFPLCGVNGHFRESHLLCAAMLLGDQVTKRGPDHGTASEQLTRPCWWQATKSYATALQGCTIKIKVKHFISETFHCTVTS